MAANLFILFMATALTVDSLASAQDVDVRAGGDKVSPDGSQAGRTIYSQRHLSPHRMMHFGKKAEERQVASFLEPIGYLQPALQFRQRARRQLQAPLAAYSNAYGLTIGNDQLLSEQNPLLTQELARYAFTQPVRIHLVTADGQELTSVNEEAEHFMNGQALELPEDSIRLFEPNGKVQYAPPTQDDLKRFAKVIAASSSSDGPRSMRLSKAGEQNDQNNSIEKVTGEQQEQQADGAISVNTRSKQSRFPGSRLNLPTSILNNLYSRPGDVFGLPYATFNKKAEPKDNLFMHFGRK